MIYLSKPAIVCCAGANANDSFNALKSGERFLSRCDEFGEQSFLLGRINFPLPEFSKNTKYEFKTRTNSILLAAMTQIEPLVLELKAQGARIGIIIGTTTGATQENGTVFSNFAKSGKFDKERFYFSQASLFNPASFMAWYFDLSDICFCISTACTSGAKALIEAARALNAGLCDAVICGGVDGLSSLTINGFNSLGILSRAYTNPFAKGRDGINIGEAAGLFVISNQMLDSDVMLAGFASNCDAYHSTQPDMQGIWQGEALSGALKMAGLSSVDYVSLHGTGTQANDKMEAHVVSKALQNVPASSIKGAIGHTLGAAGAVEFGFCAMACEQGVLIPHVASGDYDDEIESINLITKAQNVSVNNALSLSFAFGGDNVALVAKKAIS